ncbi:MAG TPA: DUF302 domain-containing protein [Acidimicrobiales bacterium]|nr:DUF302 domain-containing protein [Acidimicrobiales bacterium]
MGELTTTVTHPLSDVDAAVRAALANEGFGVLTEIDVDGVFRAKLGIERSPLKILGACNPNFAHDALERDASAALVLPCNVVLESLDESTTRVTIADPEQMMPAENMSDLTADARARLARVIAAL